VPDYGEYLYDVIRLSGRADWYIRVLADKLPSLDDRDSDPWQVVTILRRFAIEGSLPAHDAVIRAFEENAKSGGIHYLDEMLLVEGIYGLVHAARCVQLESIPEDSLWRISGAIEDLALRDGDEPTRAALRELASSHEEVRQWTAFLEAESARISDLRANVRKRESSEDVYAELLRRITSAVEKGRERAAHAVVMSIRRCSPEQVARLASELLAEHDPVRQVALLRAFRHVPFPFGHAPLMFYVESDDELVRESALRAVAQLSHPDVRSLAIEHLRSGTRSDLVVELLVHNARLGDEAMLLELCRRGEGDDVGHWMGIDMKRLMENNPAIDRGLLCLELYESGLCSMCRHGFVELLEEVGPLPDWMKAELPYDAYSSSRELVGAS
jgi:hypothetical protein